MKPQYKKYNDYELMQVIASSNDEKSDAFAELYLRYSSKVYMYCRKVMGEGNFVDDIFQETFLKFLHTIEKGVRIENPLGYLLKICRNYILNNRASNPHHFVDINEVEIPTFDDHVERNEFSKLVDVALNLLPEEHKEAFVLQTFSGLSYDEIGQATQAPITTVRNRVVRAKRKLREILTPYLEFNGKEK